MKFYENPSSGSRVFAYGRRDRGTDGREDRHDEANSRLAILRKRLKCMLRDYIS